MSKFIKIGQNSKSNKPLPTKERLNEILSDPDLIEAVRRRISTPSEPIIAYDENQFNQTADKALTEFIETISLTKNLIAAIGSRLNNVPWQGKAIAALAAIIDASRIIKNRGIVGYLKKTGGRAFGIFNIVMMPQMIIGEISKINETNQTLKNYNSQLESLSKEESLANYSKIIWAYFSTLLVIATFFMGIIPGLIVSLLLIINPGTLETLTLNNLGWSEELIENSKTIAEKNIDNLLRVFAPILSNKQPGNFYKVEGIELVDMRFNRSGTLKKGDIWDNYKVLEITPAIITEDQFDRQPFIVDLMNVKNGQIKKIVQKPIMLFGKPNLELEAGLNSWNKIYSSSDYDYLNPLAENKSLLQFRQDKIALDADSLVRKYIKQRSQKYFNKPIKLVNLLSYIETLPSSVDYITNPKHPNFPDFYTALSQAVTVFNSALSTNIPKQSKAKIIPSGSKESNNIKFDARLNDDGEWESYIRPGISQAPLRPYNIKTVTTEKRTIPVLTALSTTNNEDVTSLLSLSNAQIINLILSNAAIGAAETVPYNLRPVKDERGRRIGVPRNSSVFSGEYNLWESTLQAGTGKDQYGREHFWLADATHPRFADLMMDISKIKKEYMSYMSKPKTKPPTAPRRFKSTQPTGPGKTMGLV
jgi:hypothetical protein